MIDAQEILKSHFPESNWKIENPPAGASEQAFIADNGREKVFIKVGINAPAFTRLSDLGITPKIIYDGSNLEKPYIIQEFVEAKYPEVSWFAEHINEIAGLIKRYHQDPELRRLLDNNQSFNDHLKKEIEIIDENVGDNPTGIFDAEEVNIAVQQLKDQIATLKAVDLIPTHSDPNIKNFLLTDQGLKMIDWDDIILSDPMKDVALILWWNIPKDKWPTFFEALGEIYDEDRFYWWAARMSLSIASWFAKRGDVDNAKFFKDEFLRAMQREDNSQMFKIS
jgi:thiamine kinase-like enzyme